MSALTRFDPMDEFFPEFFRRLARPLSFDAGLPAEIRLDVSENEKEYLVSAEVPGARKDDVRVEIDRNQVTISAEVRKDVEDKHADGGRALLRVVHRRIHAHFREHLRGRRRNRISNRQINGGKSLNHSARSGAG